jgi:hypothetical protein
LEPSDIARGDVKGCSHCGKQSGGPTKSWTHALSCGSSSRDQSPQLKPHTKTNKWLFTATLPIVAKKCSAS